MNAAKMTPFILAALVVSAALSASALVARDDAAREFDYEEVVEPVDGERSLRIDGGSTLLRIRTKTKDGEAITQPVIEGPARLVRVCEVQQVDERGEVRDGWTIEMVFASTGEGDVTISIETLEGTEPRKDDYSVNWDYDAKPRLPRPWDVR